MNVLIFLWFNVHYKHPDINGGNIVKIGQLYLNAFAGVTP